MERLPGNRTLKQIAQELNLSMMSVSRALNGRKGVSEETRRRVQEYARSVRYHPNLAARALVKRRTRVLGVVFPSLRQTFWADIVLGIEEVAKAEGYTVLLAHSNERSDVERGEIQTLLARQVDALLVGSSDPEANIDLLGDIDASGRPLVLFDRYARSLDAPGVFCDDRGGGRLATEHLIGLGYRRIAHLAGPQALSVARDRQRGYEEAMAAADLPTIVVPCGFGQEAGRAGTRELLARGSADAVFAAHDPIVFGMLDVLKERRLRVPDDIAIVGYTDVDHAEHMAVPLTVMAQPTVEMGRAAGRMALDLLAGRSERGGRVVLSPKLVVRESCGARRRAAAS